VDAGVRVIGCGRWASNHRTLALIAADGQSVSAPIEFTYSFDSSRSSVICLGNCSLWCFYFGRRMALSICSSTSVSGLIGASISSGTGSVDRGGKLSGRLAPKIIKPLPKLFRNAALLSGVDGVTGIVKLLLLCVG